ncbi:MAG: hypothetical protein ACK4SY_10290 [Pyrobaculum sp.]
MVTTPYTPKRVTPYTPGHDFLVDTLILHGIVRHLAENGIRNGTIERIDDRYRIEIETNMSLPNKRKVSFRLSDKESGDVDVDLTHFSDIHLCELKHELPPEVALYGRHKVCDSCFGLTMLGFMYGVPIAKRLYGNIYVTFAPRRAPLIDVISLQRLAGIEMVWPHALVPILAVPLYLLSVRRIRLDGEHDVVAWLSSNKTIFEWRVFSLNKLVDFTTRLHDATNSWRFCAIAIMKANSVTFSSLAEYALYGGDYRKVVEEVKHIATKTNRENCELDKIEKVLADWKP